MAEKWLFMWHMNAFLMICDMHKMKYFTTEHYISEVYNSIISELVKPNGNIIYYELTDYDHVNSIGNNQTLHIYNNYNRCAIVETTAELCIYCVRDIGSECNIHYYNYYKTRIIAARVNNYIDPHMRVLFNCIALLYDNKFCDTESLKNFAMALGKGAYEVFTIHSNIDNKWFDQI
jgi:hypothetical protein